MATSDLKILVTLADQASGGLKSLQGNVEGVGTASESAGAGLLRFAGYASAAAAAMAAVKYVADSVTAFAQLGEELSNLSMKTGMSAEALSIWRYAAETSGESAQVVETAYRGMVLAMGRAASGSQETVRAFSSIGTSLNTLKALTPDEQFRTITEAVSSIPDPTMRAQIAMEIFGARVGLDILPLLTRSYGELAAGAQAAGVIMTDSMLNNADKVDDAMDELGQTAKGLRLALGEAFSGIGSDSNALATNFLKDITEMVKAFQWFAGVVGGQGPGENYQLPWDRGNQSAPMAAGATQVTNNISVTLDGREIAAAVTENQNQSYDRNGYSAVK